VFIIITPHGQPIAGVLENGIWKRKKATWLILPVVICLSQQGETANVSLNHT
jgi:hypothetical protein